MAGLTLPAPACMIRPQTAIETQADMTQEMAIPMPPEEGMKLNIGGIVRSPGWTILNVVPGPHVDILGTCTDLSMIASASCSVVYASHVMEHLGYNGELQKALAECHRVLKPGGHLLVSVPDLDVLCRLFIDPDSGPQDRFMIMRMMFGGRTDAHDVHVTGLSIDILGSFVKEAGFANGFRVADFGLFLDTSTQVHKGRPISLNLVAIKG